MDTLLDGLQGAAAPSAETVYEVQRVFVLVTAIPYFILVWDWLSNLPNEYRLFVGSSSSLPSGAGAASGSSRPRFTGGPGGVWSLRNAFLLSRYITLLWCTFVIVIYGLAGRHPHLCNWAKYFPYGYSTTMLSAHLVMVLRVNAVFERKKKVAIFLVALAVVDYAVQMSANHAATAIYLRSGNQISTCFIVPTSLVYALVFASPTIFHHIMLGMTLYKSIQHIRATRSAGVNSIMRVIQRDQVLFVLAICLINFANLVLVLQRASWPYRLINQLPAAAFTQIFLSRIIFSLRSMQKKLATAASSPAITTIPAWPSSPLQFSPRSGLGIATLTVTETGDKDAESGRHSRASDISKNLPLGSASSPPPVTAGNGKSKSNVFALHFKPSGARFSRSSRRSSEDKFRVKTHDPATESHVLSSYRMPSPPMRTSENARAQLESPISPYASRYYDGSTAAPSVASASQSPISPSFNAAPSVMHRPSLQQSTSRLSECTGLGISTPETQGSETVDAVPSSEENHPTSKKEDEEEEEEEREGGKEGSAAMKTQEPPRTSLDTIDGRRPGTIDEQQRTMDWDPPSTWESSHSARASPIPFSERRLSNSISRSPVPMALQRSRRTSAATQQQQQQSQGRLSFSSLTGVSGAQQQRPNRGSACYASVFSFDNEEAVDEDEDGEGSSVGRGRNTLASRVRKSSEVARRSFSAFTSSKQV